jgi:hypothetical protein
MLLPEIVLGFGDKLARHRSQQRSRRSGLLLHGTCRTHRKVYRDDICFCQQLLHCILVLGVITFWKGCKWLAIMVYDLGVPSQGHSASYNLPDSAEPDDTELLVLRITS